MLSNTKLPFSDESESELELKISKIVNPIIKKKEKLKDLWILILLFLSFYFWKLLSMNNYVFYKFLCLET